MYNSVVQPKSAMAAKWCISNLFPLTVPIRDCQIQQRIVSGSSCSVEMRRGQFSGAVFLALIISSYWIFWFYLVLQNWGDNIHLQSDLLYVLWLASLSLNSTAHSFAVALQCFCQNHSVQFVFYSFLLFLQSLFFHCSLILCLSH